MLILGEHVAGTAAIGGLVVLTGIWLVQGGRLPTLPSASGRPLARVLTAPA